ncbi:hypothetical protein [Fangia hongkongensis]|uniref:hypothetical protein n=1 Tax=Fangia hongkongensis TaxID=270495 RepID=UPI0003717003|nr:hypothetical protein [Fangia hongkongensis]MBK2124933.1 hypothetical protein [Fangia hongkongensis]
MQNRYDDAWDYHKKWGNGAIGRATIRLEDRQRGSTEEFEVQFMKTLFAQNTTKYTKPNNGDKFHSAE